MRSLAPFIFLCTLILQATMTPAAALDHQLVIAASSQASAPAAAGGEKKLSPEEKMQARHPQPIRAGDLIGLPVLDWSDRTIGYVQQVVRTPEGKVQLIVPYGKWFGWARSGLFDKIRRPVQVPIETVAILGRQLAALDMERTEFDAAPIWSGSQSRPIHPDETIRIAVANR